MRRYPDVPSLLVVAVAGCITIPRPVVAQSPADSTADATSHVRGLRSPNTATVLGALVPGAGLMYAGHWRRGILTYEGAVGGVGLGALLLIASDCSLQHPVAEGGPCNKNELRLEQALGISAVAVGAWVWANGAIQAKRTVERDNREKLAAAEHRFGAIEPTFGVPVVSGAPWRLGVHATW